MKARFEIRSIKSQWKPPFNKDITDEVFDVKEGEQFDRIVGNGNDEAVFKLISVNPGSAKIEYSKLFTLKKHSSVNHVITLLKDETASMTYLWGEDGITKKITFKGPGLESETKTQENQNINENETPSENDCSCEEKCETDCNCTQENKSVEEKEALSDLPGSDRYTEIIPGKKN